MVDQMKAAVIGYLKRGGQSTVLLAHCLLNGVWEETAEGLVQVKINR
jgi:hypothetical protein